MATDGLSGGCAHIALLGNPRSGDEGAPPDPTLPQGPLHAPERPVGGHIEVESLRGASVVGSEDDRGRFCHTRALQSRHHGVDGVVERGDHARDGAAV